MSAMRRPHWPRLALAILLAVAPGLPALAVQPGEILPELQGAGGFGYDPLFFVPEFGQTAAEMDAETKNRVSHRGRAMQKLIERLPSL